MSRRRISATELRTKLAYNADSGVFTWLVSSGGQWAGAVAGYIHHQGYRWIGRYQEHTLAWLYVHSRWPQRQIDHINGNRADNRIANLREVSQSENSQNQARCNSRNKVGLLGVSRCANRFQASIEVRGKRTHLGTFDTPEAAHAAYMSAKKRLHPASRRLGVCV